MRACLVGLPLLCCSSLCGAPPQTDSLKSLNPCVSLRCKPPWSLASIKPPLGIFLRPAARTHKVRGGRWVTCSSNTPSPLRHMSSSTVVAPHTPRRGRLGRRLLASVGTGVQRELPPPPLPPPPSLYSRTERRTGPGHVACKCPSSATWWHRSARSSGCGFF